MNHIFTIENGGREADSFLVHARLYSLELDIGESLFNALETELVILEKPVFADLVFNDHLVRVFFDDEGEEEVNAIHITDDVGSQVTFTGPAFFVGLDEGECVSFPIEMDEFAPLIGRQLIMCEIEADTGDLILECLDKNVLH